MKLINCIVKHTELLSVLVLILQLFLIWGQLRLSKKINDQTISKEKGYFLITRTNFPPQIEDSDGSFDITRGIPFYVTGNSDVIIHSATYSIDGREYIEGVPESTYFTLDSRANKLYVILKLSKQDLSKNSLDITFTFQLENPSGFRYKEITDTRFLRDENDYDIWKLERFNIRFK